MTVNMALNVTPKTFTQGYSEVSLNEVSRDLRLSETAEVKNHGHKQKGLEIISRKIIRLAGKLYEKSC